MSFFETKRLFAIVLALLLASFFLLSPLLNVYGEHNHTCSVNRCMLCLTSGVLSVLRDIFAVSLICAVYALLAICLLNVRRADFSARNSTPVDLKIKITS